MGDEMRRVIARTIRAHSRVGMPLGDLVQRLSRDGHDPREVWQTAQAMAGDGDLYWRNKRHPNRLLVANERLLYDEPAGSAVEQPQLGGM